MVDGDGGLCLYRRCRRLQGSEECASKHLVPCSRLRVEPLYPVFYPEHLTNYVMVRFPVPVVLDQGVSVRLDFAVGFDVGIMAGNSIVDAFPSVSPPKYALYGPPTRGVLARVLHAEPWSGVGGGCRARLSIVIGNAYRDPVRVERVVFPVDGVKLEVDDNGTPTYPYPVTVSVTSPYTALVSLGGGGVYTRRGSGKVFVMSYGL